MTVSTSNYYNRQSWEADSCSVGQESPCLLWNPKV